MPPRGSKAPAKTAPRPSLVIDRFHDTQRCIHYNCPQDEFTSFAHLQRHAYKFHRPRLLSGELDFSVPPEMPSSNKGDRYMFVRQYTADRSQGAVAVRNDPDPERWEDVSSPSSLQTINRAELLLGKLEFVVYLACRKEIGNLWPQEKSSASLMNS